MLTFLGGISNCKEIVLLNVLNHFGFTDMYKLLGRYLDFRCNHRAVGVNGLNIWFETGLREAIQQMYGIRLVPLANLEEVYAAIRQKRYPIIRVNSYYIPYMTVYYQKQHVYHYIIADKLDVAQDKIRVFDELFSHYDYVAREIVEKAAHWGKWDAFMLDFQTASRPNEARWHDFLLRQSEQLYRDYLAESTVAGGEKSLLCCRDVIARLHELDPYSREVEVDLLLRDLVSIPYLRKGFARYAEAVYGPSRFTQEAQMVAGDWQRLYNSLLRQLFQSESLIPEITEKLDIIRKRERKLVRENYAFFHEQGGRGGQANPG